MTALAGHRRIYLDANVFIYVVEAVSPHADAVRPILAAMTDGTVQATTSELTFGEVLVAPARSGDIHLQHTYTQFLYRTIGLSTIAVSREILVEAARLRATSSLRLPDAIHVATARSEHCSAFVTNDLRLKSLPGIATVLLADLSAA